MGFEEGEKRARRWSGQGGGGNEGTDTSLITSFLSMFFFFMNRHCQNNGRQKGKCRTEAQAPLKTFCNASL